MSNVGNGRYSLSVNFNTLVKRPIIPTYIRIFYNNGTIKMTLDVSNSEIVTYSDQGSFTKLIWSTNTNFQNGKYFLTFDKGIGLEKTYCSIQTDSISDTETFQFIINEYSVNFKFCFSKAVNHKCLNHFVSIYIYIYNFVYNIYKKI